MKKLGSPDSREPVRICLLELERGEVGCGEVAEGVRSVGRVEPGAAAGVASLPGDPGQHVLPGGEALRLPAVRHRLRAPVGRRREDEHLDLSTLTY